MSEKMFYLYVNDEQTEPLPVSEIVEKLKNNTYKLSDLIYDEESESWVTIVSHSYIMKCVAGVDPSEEPTFPGKGEKSEGGKKEVSEEASQAPLEELSEASNGASDGVVENKEGSKLDDDKRSQYTEKSWFVLRDEDRYGPFDYIEVSQMLLSGLIYEYDYAWKHGLDQWAKIAEISDFEKSNIEKVSLMEDVNFGESLKDRFFRRKYPRRLCDIPVVIQSGKSLFIGTGISIGESGAAITIENANIENKSEILLDFKPGDYLPSFSAECKIVNITKDGKGVSRYGVEFIKLDPYIQNQIANFAIPENVPDLPNKEQA